MPKTPPAQVEPALLVWARETIGFTAEEAAKKLGITLERLAEWESGETAPTIAKLRAMADVYKRPLAVFFLSEPPKDFQALSDFRRLPESEIGKLSPPLRLAIRRARFQQEAAVELREMTEEPMRDAPGLEVGTQNPESFGNAARELLGVPLTTQRNWGDEGTALNAWIEALEDLDVLVLHAQRVAVSEMRGFSISAAKAPVIVLNGADWPRARIFTLLHEFAHILLNDAGVCDLHDRRPDQATGDIEVFCNRAAAAILLPGESFDADARGIGVPSSGRWEDNDLWALAQRYSVSQEVVLRRLFSLDLTTWDFLREKQQEYRKVYEEQRSREGESTGGPSYYVMRIRDLGRSYIRTALEAYHRDEINASELAGYIEVKLNNLPKLEEALARREGRP